MSLFWFQTPQKISYCFLDLHLHWIYLWLKYIYMRKINSIESSCTIENQMTIYEVYQNNLTKKTQTSWGHIYPGYLNCMGNIKIIPVKCVLPFILLLSDEWGIKRLQMIQGCRWEHVWGVLYCYEIIYSKFASAVIFLSEFKSYSSKFAEVTFCQKL